MTAIVSHLGCDFCGGRLETAYNAVGSAWDVCVCLNCGLVQSVNWARTADVPHDPSLSAGARFGNIRYGKSLVRDDDIDRLSKYVDWPETKAILDVGSNRGAFLKKVREMAPQADLYGIEPDPKVIDYYSIATIANVRLEHWLHPNPGVTFDLIYCSHTLEHLPSAKLGISKMKSHLALGQFLYVRVPNLNEIGDPAIMEEYFIDKHSFHFTPMTLEQYFVAEGLGYEMGVSDADIWVVAWKKNPRPMFGMIGDYASTLLRNREKLITVAHTINGMAPTVVIWGGGRIYTSLISSGLQWEIPVIDTYLPKDASHPKVMRPDEFFNSPHSAVMNIVILSREYENEIRSEAQSRGHHNIITIRELLQESSTAGAPSHMEGP
jgi:SAM-dependent methyltransferase